MLDDEFYDQDTAALLRGGNKKKIHLGLERSARATVEQVLDRRTIAILSKLKNHGILTEINGTVSTGKEANVYHGTSPDREVAIKVFRTSILSFKDRAKYVEGEYRYRYGYSGSGNPRKMVRQWAEKEFRNLQRISRRGLRCPTALILKENVLLMSFLGNDGEASPRLKDVQLTQLTWRKLYIEAITVMRILFQDCRLVHGDLSEYNMLLHEGRLYVIDVSQAVERNHEHSLDFLKRDCVNISKYFQRVFSNSVGRSCEVVTDSALHHEGQNALIADTRRVAVLDPVSSGCDTTVAVAVPKEIDQIDNLSKTKQRTEAECNDGLEPWSPLPIRVLFEMIVSKDSIIGLEKVDPYYQVENRLVETVEAEICNDVDTDDGREMLRHLDPLARAKAARRETEFEYQCAEILHFVIQYWEMRGSREERFLCSEQGTNADSDEQVFINTWIPSNLHQISDFCLKEENERLIRIADDHPLLFGSLLKDVKCNGLSPEAPLGDEKSSSTSSDGDAGSQDGRADNNRGLKLTDSGGTNLLESPGRITGLLSSDYKSADYEIRDGSESSSASNSNESTGDSEVSDRESSDDEEETEGGTCKAKGSRHSKPSYVDGKFTGVLPEGIARREWKKLIREEKQEKRKTKIPKTVKKRYEKKRKKKK